MNSEAQGSEVQSPATKPTHLARLLGQAATLPQKAGPGPRTKPWRVSPSWAPEPQLSMLRRDASPQPPSRPSLGDLRLRDLLCHLFQVPLLSLRSLSGLPLPTEAEREGLESRAGVPLPCHMASAGHIAAFHMAAQTQAVVFMKILLIPAQSLPGTQGSCSDCGVFCLEEQLTQGAGKARCWVRGDGHGPLHPE